MRGLLLVIAGCAYSPEPAPPVTTTDATPVDGASDSMASDSMVTVDSPPDAPPPDTLPPACPAGYQEANGSHYRFVNTPSAWLIAEADCEDDGFGTHLVIVANVSELVEVDALSSASNTWVGASNLTTVWKWVDGTTAPTLSGDLAECGRYYDAVGGGTAGLQATACNLNRPYLCECDQVEPDPTSF